MPLIPQEMLPHPKSLNNITLTVLLKQTRISTLHKFLTKDLCGISPACATQIIASCIGLDSEIEPSQLSSSQIAGLCQVLHSDTSIKPPVATGLSPAGEYNIRLGKIHCMIRLSI